MKDSCYQCGRNDPVIGEDDPEWVVCGHCGSRLWSAEEFLQMLRQAEEERMKRALGVDNFKPSTD